MIGFLIGAGVGTITGLVISYLHNMYAFRTQLDNRSNTAFTFSGNLQQTSLIDAIQFLEIGKREGVLHIYCGRRKGYVTFSQGQVIDAMYRDIIGREAVFAMLDLAEGDFYFEPKLIRQPAVINESIMDLVMSWDMNRNG